MESKIFNPFGPSILKVKIPEKLVQQINNYVDEIISNEKKTKNLDYGPSLAGDVTQEFKLEHKFSKEIGWLDFLGKCTHQWIDLEYKKKITEFKLIESWVVRQFKDEYNPVHWHSGHVSGAGFLKLPKTFGSHVQEDKAKENYIGGTLNLIHGSKQFLSKSLYTIKPKVGDFYFFPNYLMHTVYPFRGTDEERRSISFNAYIDEKIHNVYSG
tara:strand:+ start:1288 stop:1923 length:636 start_codon:yes stop_codon:yes gene_type:complete